MGRTLGLMPYGLPWGEAFLEHRWPQVWGVTCIWGALQFEVYSPEEAHASDFSHTLHLGACNSLSHLVFT